MLTPEEIETINTNLVATKRASMGTHYADCWKVHSECAIQWLLDELQDWYDTAQDALSEIKRLRAIDGRVST